MSATLLAQVRRVVLGNDGRALIHAVDEGGLEHKIEVPAELVRDAGASGGRRVLLLAWSLHELPELPDLGETATTTTAAPTTSEASTSAAPTLDTAAAPRDVDAAFMALLGRRPALPLEAGPAADPTASPPSATRGSELPLAALLGLVPGATSS